MPLLLACFSFDVFPFRVGWQVIESRVPNLWRRWSRWVDGKQSKEANCIKEHKMEQQHSL